MQSPKNYLIAFLALTTLGLGGLAWWQAGLIAVQRTQPPAADQVDLRKRTWDAEKRVQALEAELAARPAPAPAGEATLALATPAVGGGQRGRRAEGNFMQILENPEYQKLMALQQKGQLDGRYAALFKKLGLSAAQLDAFKQLLVEKQTVSMDVFAAARAEGLDPRSDPAAVRQLLSGAQSEVDASIKAAIGDAAFAEYQNYEQTLPYQHSVSQLEQRLSYGGTPLTETQSQQMLQIFAETNPRPQGAATRTAVATALGGVNVSFGGGVINDATIARAQTVLNADQVAALRQLQQEQQAQAQMGQLFRNQAGGATTPGAQGQATTTAR